MRLRRRHFALPLLAALWGALDASCVELDEKPAWQVDSPRILALEADPPEAAPGVEVAYRAWPVDQHGNLSDAPIAFGYCLDAKPLGDNRIAANSCVNGHVTSLPGDGLQRTAALPSDTCARFGPLVGPDRRPRDPDASGVTTNPCASRAQA